MAKNREQRLLSDLEAMEADHLGGTGDFDAFLDRWAETISNIQAALAQDFLSQHALQCIQETFSTVLAPAAIVHQAISQLESGIVDDIADAFDDLTLFNPDDEDEEDGFIDEPDPPNYLEDWLVANIAYPFATSSNPTPEFLKLVDMSKTSFISWLSTARESIGWNLLAEDLVHGDRSSMRKLCKIVFHGAPTNSSGLLRLAESSRTMLLDIKTAIVEYCTPPSPPWLEDATRLLEELRDQPSFEWDEDFDWEGAEYRPFSWEDPLHSKAQQYVSPWVMKEENIKPIIDHPLSQDSHPPEKKKPLCWRSSPASPRDGDVGTRRATKLEDGRPLKDKGGESRIPPLKTEGNGPDVRPKLDAESNARKTVSEARSPTPPSEKASPLHTELIRPPRVAGIKRKLDDYTDSTDVSECLHSTFTRSITSPQYHNVPPSPISNSPTLEDAVTTRPTKRTRLDATPESTYNLITSSSTAPNNHADYDIIASSLFCPSSPSSFGSPDASSPLSASSGSDAGSPYQLFSPPAQDHVQGHNLHKKPTHSISSVLRDTSTSPPCSADDPTSRDLTLSDPQNSLDLSSIDQPASSLPPCDPSCNLSCLPSSATSVVNVPRQQVLANSTDSKNSNQLRQVQIDGEPSKVESQESPIYLSRPSPPEMHIERKRKRSTSSVRETTSAPPTPPFVACRCKTQAPGHIHKNRNPRARRDMVLQRCQVPRSLSIDSPEQGYDSSLCQQPQPQNLQPAGEADFRPRKRANLAQRDYSLGPDP